MDLSSLCPFVQIPWPPLLTATKQTGVLVLRDREVGVSPSHAYLILMCHMSCVKSANLKLISMLGCKDTCCFYRLGAFSGLLLLLNTGRGRGTAAS